MCDAELTLVDTATGQIIGLRRDNVIIADNNISFSTKNLSKNHSYNITVFATNFAGSATSYTAIDTKTSINMLTDTTITTPEYPADIHGMSSVVSKD